MTMKILYLQQLSGWQSTCLLLDINARTKRNLGFTALAGIALTVGTAGTIRIHQMGDPLRQSSIVTTRKVRLLGGFRSELVQSRPATRK